MRLRPILVVICAVLLITTAASIATADGLVRDGTGPISTGRGATNLGFADNAAIILDNPAGMSNVAGTGLVEGGVDTLLTDIQYSDPQNPNVQAVGRACPCGFIGYIQRAQDSPWTYGIGAFSPAGFSAQFTQVNPLFGPTMYRSLGLMGKLLPSVSYQWNDRLSIGGNLGLAIGHTALEGPFTIQTGPFAGAPTLLDLHTTGAAVCGGVGLQYLLTPDTVLGVSYTEQTAFNNSDGNARATILTPFGPLTSGFDAHTRLVWPRSLGVGVKQNLCCCQRVGFDVIWYNWSQAFNQFDITLTNPTNPIVAGLLGPSYHDAFPMQWHDTVSMRMGYEWDSSDRMTWRTGYVYHPSPVPNATLNSYTDGVLLHTFSAGCSYRLPRGMFNFAYQYMMAPRRFVGTSDIVGGDFANSTYKAQAHWVNLSYLIPF